MRNPYRIRAHKRIYRRSLGSMVLRGAAVVMGIAVLFGLGWVLYSPVSNLLARLSEPPAVEQHPEQEQKPTTLQQEEQPAVPQQEQSQQEQPQGRKTAFLPASVAADQEQFAAALTEAKAQGYDSIMLPLKEADGALNYAIAYDPEVDGLCLGTNIFDLAAAVQQIKEAGLMPVATLHAFQDKRYASATAGAGVMYRGTDYLWLDDAPENGGRGWLNPYSEKAQNYVEKIMADAAAAGFEKIVVQSLQFPVGYAMEQMDFGSGITESKQQLLQRYSDQLEQWGQEQGVAVEIALPATSMLGGDSRAYDGDSTALATQSVVVLANPSSFGNQFTTEELSLPQPQADPAQTVEAILQAAQKKLPGHTVTVLVSAGEVTTQQLEQAGVTCYIVENPTF